MEGALAAIERCGYNRYNIDDELRNHIELIDVTVSRKRGIGGAHNKEEFLKNDIQIVKSTPHSEIDGVEIIEYQMQKLDKTGVAIPGQYQTGIPKVKTIYDPNIISTDEYLQRGLDAANNAAKYCVDGILPKEWVGFDKKGVKWRGYYRFGKITSFYPE